MSRTRRHDKATYRQNGRDHQSCAPCWQCLTGTKPKRGARKRERRDGKQRIRQEDDDA